jgi:acyl-CoA thioesterase YciA
MTEQRYRMCSRAREHFPALLEHKQAAIKVIAMPADANMNGDIFGGWLMSQIDLAGLVPTQRVSGGRAATVAVNNILFRAPVYIGDLVCCYTEITKVGNTSVTVQIEVVAEHSDLSLPDHVASAELIYVCIDAEGNKRRVKA